MGSATLSTRSRRDWPFGDEEEEEKAVSGRSEWEETQPTASGDLPLLQEGIHKLNTA